MYEVLVRPEKSDSVELHVGHTSNRVSDIMKYL